MNGERFPSEKEQLDNYREQLEINTKIKRPRQIYTGESLRKVTPRNER